MSISKIINQSFNTETITLDAYIKKTQSGEWRRKIFLGVGGKGWLIKDPVKNPGVLCLGEMGSGKTTTIKGVCLTSLLSTGDRAWMPFFDASDKNGLDYSPFFGYPNNTCYATGSIEKIIPFLDLHYRELKARGLAFKDMGAADIGKYEDLYEYRKRRYVFLYNKAVDDQKLSFLSKTTSDNDLHMHLKLKYSLNYSAVKFEKKDKGAVREMQEQYRMDLGDKAFLHYIGSKNILRLTPEVNKLIVKFATAEPLSDQEVALLKYNKEFYGAAQMYTLFEEFHTIPDSPQVAFDENKKTFGTAAYQLYQIARTGRSLGMTIFVATQRANWAELPTDIRSGITNVLCHKVTDPNAVGGYDLGRAAEIRNQGRALTTTDGFIQYPYFDDKTMIQLMEKYLKPNKGEMFGTTQEEWHTVLEQEGSGGMIKNYPLDSIVKNYRVFYDEVSGVNRIPEITDRILNMFDFKTTIRTTRGITIEAIAERDGKKYGVITVVINRRSSDDISDNFMNNIENEKEMLQLDGTIIFVYGESRRLSRGQTDPNDIVVDIEDMKAISEVFESRKELEEKGFWKRKYKVLKLAKEESEDGKNDDIINDDLEDRDGYIKKRQEEEFNLLESFNLKSSAIIEV
jgi:hypothetical protein